MKMVVAVPVQDFEKSEGYLPRMNLPDGELGGEAVVKVEDGYATCMVINLNSNLVDIDIGPQAVEEFEFTHPSSDGDESDDPSMENSNRITNPEKRIKILLQKIPLGHLNEEDKEQVQALIQNNHDVFHLPGDKLGCSKNFTCRIETTTNEPVRIKQYRFPPEHREEIARQVENLEKQGIIRKSNSPCNSPLWTVPKKSNDPSIKKYRMVIDFRQLNKITRGDAYPLPLIIDILDQLGDANFFSVFDLAMGFHQVLIHPADAPQTAFSTPDGHWEYCCMSFGLECAPSIFQRMMDSMLSGLKGTELFIYIDDLVIYGKNLAEHGVRVQRLFNRLREAGLTLQPEKCKFLCPEVDYLGHVITKEGIPPDPKKISSLKNASRPRNHTEARKFMGLANYYRRFIQNFAERAKPITDLTRKTKPFIWTEEAQAAFDDIKNALCEDSFLKYPDFNKPFILAVSASDSGISGILSQAATMGDDDPDGDGEKIVSCISRVFHDTETRYTDVEKQCLAVIYAIQQFRPYLQKHFTLITSSPCVTWLRDSATVTERQAKWRSKLSRYKFNVVVRHKITEQYAEGLSYNPEGRPEPSGNPTL
ncbi:GSCOCG00012199001-RA-CDS [Cotesia congregata]|nr:GSCOCG00012199001-RA-CDS [Cotesia congregata]